MSTPTRTKSRKKLWLLALPLLGLMGAGVYSSSPAKGTLVLTMSERFPSYAAGKQEADNAALRAFRRYPRVAKVTVNWPVAAKGSKIAVVHSAVYGS